MGSKFITPPHSDQKFYIKTNCFKQSKFAFHFQDKMTLPTLVFKNDKPSILYSELCALYIYACFKFCTIFSHKNDLVIANRLLLFYQLPLPKHSVKYKRGKS